MIDEDKPSKEISAIHKKKEETNDTQKSKAIDKKNSTETTRTRSGA